MRSGPTSACSSRATKCFTPARSCARAPIRKFIWSTSASSARSRRSLSFAQAAALPLTSITAWEVLFDRLGAVPGKSLDPRTLLITGGAGGVGSILIAASAAQ
jgi:NADPH:quinone reductase-like Zn-dependent oxidoreductase